MEGKFLCSAPTFLFLLLLFSTYTTLVYTIQPISSKTYNYYSIDYIKKSCNTTQYPQLCYKYLSSYSNNIKNNSKVLAISALSVTLSITRSTLQTMKTISKISDLKPREIGAMKDCIEELNDSIDGIQKSIKEFNMSHGKNDPKFDFEMNDVKTWVSAALSDDDTCMDGFDEISKNGQVKTMVRKFILRIAHLTSISLTFINHYANQ